MTSGSLFQNTFIFRKPRVANFGSINILQLYLLKQPLKTQKNVKSTRNYVLKCSLHLYFLIKQKLPIPDEKMLISAKFKGCVTYVNSVVFVR